MALYGLDGRHDARSRHRWLNRFQTVLLVLTLVGIAAAAGSLLFGESDSRHYYAHAAGDLRDKAAKDWILLRYGDFVAALSNLEILSLLGLSDEDAIRLANSYWMSETLALNKYPNHKADP